MIAWLLAGILGGGITGTALSVQRRSRRGWQLDVDLLTGEQDLMPLRDLVAHEHGDDCLCGPETIPVQHDDGTIRWTYKHHSLDGRERKEGQRGPLAQ